MKLFVSYSRDDKFAVHALAAALRDEVQHDVWIDRRLVGAELWWAAILEQIEACQCFIAILTPRSAASIYCTAELAYALALHKPVLPVLLKPCDLPPDLKDVQFEDVANLSPERTLLRMTQALHAVEIRETRNPHELPAIPPDRPLPPEPEARPEHAFELFAAAEEAFAAGDERLAARLYQKVNEADPTGLGAEATSRLRDMRYAHSRATAYTQLERLVSNPATRDGAKAAWKVYVARYGKVYDPNNYASLLTDPLGQTAPLSPDRLPPEPVLLTADTAKLSNYGVETPLRPAFELPMLEWCDIPAGQVTIEKHGVYHVEAFRMAKYPVTNAQFQIFIDSPDGYASPVWWNFSEAARAWREGNIEQPYITGDTCPRETISWYEAMAFCRWLAAKTGLPITLPTEMQWQRAAQGDDGRAYPWGNKFDETKCNTRESNIGRTTPVDRYPQGVSPYGVLDMSGNTWEWCLNEYNTPEVFSVSNIDNTKRVAMRGGGWYFAQILARVTCRSSEYPDLRNPDRGFRICASAPIHQRTDDE